MKKHSWHSKHTESKQTESIPKDPRVEIMQEEAASVKVVLDDIKEQYQQLTISSKKKLNELQTQKMEAIQEILQHVERLKK